MRASPVGLLGLLAAAAPIGCDRVEPGADAAELAGVGVRDSAGITIVEVPAAAIDRLPAFRLASVPIASIGVEDGEEPYLFTQVNTTWPLEDGGTAVHDRETSEFRFFDAAGSFVRKIGGIGEGPGEFTRALFAASVRGSIHPDGHAAVWDQGQRRVSLFGPDGALTGEWLHESDACQHEERGSGRVRSCTVTSVFPDGTLLLTATDAVDAEACPLGHVFDDLRMRLFLETPEGVREVASVPMPPETVVSRVVASGDTRVGASARLFEYGPDLAVGPERFAVLLRDRYEVRVFDVRGDLERVIRVAVDPVPISEEEKDRALAEAADSWRAVGVADFRPATGDFAFGAGDELWVRDWTQDEITGPDAPRIWTVFDREGLPVARVALPDGEVMEDRAISPFGTRPGRDAYRVVTYDSLSVQRVLVFPLEPVGG